MGETRNGTCSRKPWFIQRPSWLKFVFALQCTEVLEKLNSCLLYFGAWICFVSRSIKKDLLCLRRRKFHQQARRFQSFHSTSRCWFSATIEVKELKMSFGQFLKIRMSFHWSVLGLISRLSIINWPKVEHCTTLRYNKYT